VIHKKTQVKGRTLEDGFRSNGPLITRLEQIARDLEAVPKRKELMFHVRLPESIGKGLKAAAKAGEAATVSNLVRSVLTDYLIALWKEAREGVDGRNELYSAKATGKRIADLIKRKESK
jgi:alpha-D-ribose 1-methylphosphonate 5-triphosphate synthase subunit PhnL